MLTAWLVGCVAAPPDAVERRPDSGGLDSAPVADSGGEADARVQFGEAVVCADGPSTPSWTEQAAALGLVIPGSGTTMQGEHGGALTVADLDGDGRADIVHSYLSELRYFTRDGARFVPGEAGDVHDYGEVYGAAPSDLDGDGDLDILLAGKSPTVLWNEGGRLMRGAPLGTALDPRIEPRKLVPLQFDDDGIADLFVLAASNDPDTTLRRDFVLLGRADGSFVAGPALEPQEEAEHQGFDVVRADLDDDDVLDLYVVSDMLTGNTYWRGTPRGLELGNDACLCDVDMRGMGGSALDVDRDGRLELFLTAAQGQLVLHPLEDGSFVDATAVYGLSGGAEMGWGAPVGDVDNDGFDDIMRLGAELEHPDDPTSTDLSGGARILRNVAGGGFEVDGLALGAPLGGYRSAVLWDDNGDGVLDVLLGDVTQPPQLYLSDGCTTNSWVEVDAPDGSLVDLIAGGRSSRLRLLADSSYQAYRPLTAHFGLGDVENVEQLVVTLPDGDRVEVGAFSARRRVVVRP